jgi:archaellum biogenesis protein FlaJ (TadC family)
MVRDLDAVGTSEQMLSHLDKFRGIFQEVMRKYRVIYVGYVFSLATFFATVYLSYFDVPWLRTLFRTYYLEQLIFATMVFSVFMLVYFVREQERVRYEMRLTEQQKIREGVWIAEQEIRNQIILINQATHIAEKKSEFSCDLIKASEGRRRPPGDKGDARRR